MTKSITELANELGTDKGTQIGAAHGYSLVYELLFSSLRDKSRVNILEMGLAIGGPELGGDVDRDIAGAPSVDTWLRYFPNSHVTGFDISDFSVLRHERFSFVRGDSGNREDLEKLKFVTETLDCEAGGASNKRFDIIIDDASHASYHQQLGLAVLFELLKPGGLYVIEDLSWQPQGIELELPRVPRTTELLARFASSGVFPNSNAISNEAAILLEREISSVSLFEESLLNSMADSYNRRFGLPRILRPGWRGRGGLERVLDPYFWLFCMRRFKQSITRQEFVNHQSVKLAVLQRV